MSTVIKGGTIVTADRTYELMYGRKRCHHDIGNGLPE